MALVQSSKKILTGTLLRRKGCSLSWGANRASISSFVTSNFRTTNSSFDRLKTKSRFHVPEVSITPSMVNGCRWTSSSTTDTPSSGSSSPTTTTIQISINDKKSPFRIPKTLAKYVWPSDKSTESRKRKQQVVLALSLMLAGKAVTIQVPYIFKSLVDTIQMDGAGAIEAAASLSSSTMDLTTMTTAAGVPVIVMLLGYGMSRAAASGFQELRNAVFANVTQQAIRKVGSSVFHHVHSLDMQFHLSKNTGKISRILDRGNRSISFVLNAMVFHVAPTTVEVGLVTGLVYYQFGSSHAGVVLSTIAAYTLFTGGITQWRTKFRRDMNRLENQASGRVVDSLVNYETVQYFNNLPHET